MTDAFDDFEGTDSPTDSPTDSLTDRPTDSDSEETVTNVFTDDVRSTIPEEDDIRNEGRYADTDTDSEADDVDPRKLFRQPTLNELRYYAREGPYGPTIIHKPLRDAFKHGFEVSGDNTDGKVKEFLDEYKDYYIEAETKARRDGLAVLMFQVADSAPSASEAIPDADKQRGTATHEGFQIWTVDNLSDDLARETVAEHTDYTNDQIYVSEGAENGGVAIVDDVSHPDHGNVVGYGVEPRVDSTDVQTVSFIHASRCQHFTWNEHVDGELGNNVTGKHVGESVLTAILQPLKATQMGFWAIKNILYRYSAPLYAVEPPETWGQEEWDNAEENLGNVSAASDALLPPGSELNVADTDQEFDPQPIYEVLHEAICSGTIFTKSVLRGTQTGTVSGSETDVKGYFTEVSNFRQQRVESKFMQALRMVSQYDQSTVPRLSGLDSIEIDWGALFKLSDMERMEGMVSAVTAATNGVTNYLLTPDEARSILQESWAELDRDVELDPLEEDDLDEMDRVRLRLAGQGPNDDEPRSSVRSPASQASEDDEPINSEQGPAGNQSDPTPRENSQIQNGGGQPEGQNRESSQPARATADGLSDEELDALADRLAERLTDTS